MQGVFQVNASMMRPTEDYIERRGLGQMVRITIKEQRGVCVAGHRVGDVFTYDGLRLPEGMCAAMWNVVYPIAKALAGGCEFSWMVDGKAKLACPDADNPVVFEITARGQR